MERHDILAMMAELKLLGMRLAFDEVLTNGVKRQHPAQQIIGDLLAAEIAEKHARSIRYQVGAAKLPLAKELADFDFRGSPINEGLVRELAVGTFLSQQRNAVLVGGTGTGKSHLAVAIARNCIRAGARCRFYTVVDLVNRLEAESKAGRAGKIADALTRLDLVVLDELGYLPFAQSGGQLLFHLIAIRSTKGEGESRSLRTCSCDSGASCAGRTGGSGGAAQAAPRRGLRGRRGRGRVTSAGRRAEHGACRCPVINVRPSLYARLPPRPGGHDRRLPSSGRAREWRRSRVPCSVPRCGTRFRRRHASRW